MAGLAAALVACPEEKSRIDATLTHARQRLLWAQHRDRIQAERPTDCWCLGAGGRGRYVVNEWAPSAWLTQLPEGTRAYGEYCPCPDGVAMAARIAACRTAAAEAASAARLARLLPRAKIPPRFERCGFSNFPVTPATTEVVEQVRYWVQGPNEEAVEDIEVAWDQWDTRRRSLLLYGGFGTGKTSLAVAALRLRIKETEEPGLFMTVPDLLDSIRATYNRRRGDADDDDGPTTEEEVLDAVKESAFLVLDDLGAERVTDWVAERLFVIINYRHDHDLTTIFTSNLSPEQLGDHLGERITWRIIEMCEVIKLDGPNLRDCAGRSV